MRKTKQEGYLDIDVFNFVIRLLQRLVSLNVIIENIKLVSSIYYSLKLYVILPPLDEE